MTTIKKLFAVVFMATLLTMNFSCFGGNKIDNYISQSEKLVEKWDSKISDDEQLSDSDKKDLRKDLAELKKIQLDIEKNPDLAVDITDEQREKLMEVGMKIATLGLMTL